MIELKQAILLWADSLGHANRWWYQIIFDLVVAAVLLHLLFEK